MAPEADLQAQQSHTNLYRFRRLKWGGPPARFKLVNVLRAKPQPALSSQIESVQETPVVQLDQTKRAWPLVDKMLLGSIGVSITIIVLVLLS